MIVPQFWAEANAKQTRTKDRAQITVRRFGWSDKSQADAEAMAQRRADEALARLATGEKLPRSEPKVGYNGAEGVPIREEILERHGDTVITRNSYGAQCLNTPDVVFADIDFEERPGCLPTLWTGLVLVAMSVFAIAWLKSGMAALVCVIAVLVLSHPLANLIIKTLVRLRGGPEGAAIARLRRFCARNRDWSLRLYRTPAGLRILVMHQPFKATDPVVAEFFKAIGVDRLYAQMCLNQDCFRARLTPKPWRIGISDHMKPRPGTWPVRPERLAGRQEWIATYEEKSAGFAACRFTEEIGTGLTHAKTVPVRDLHDRKCRATSGREIA